MEGIMRNRSMLLVGMLGILLFSGLCYADALDDSLAKAKKEGKSVMLELGSVGCKPCEEMKPVMEKLRKDFAGKLEVIFVDVRKNKDAGETYDVFFLPTQVFLDKDGKEFHRHYGFYAHEEIVPVLKKFGF
jgi:thioredoxin 1